jgi:hypothetical protein
MFMNASSRYVAGIREIEYRSTTIGPKPKPRYAYDTSAFLVTSGSRLLWECVLATVRINQRNFRDNVNLKQGTRNTSSVHGELLVWVVSILSSISPGERCRNKLGKTSLAHLLIHLLTSYLAYLIRGPQTNFYVCYYPLRDFLDVAAFDRGSCGHHSFTGRMYKEESRQGRRQPIPLSPMKSVLFLIIFSVVTAVVHGSAVGLEPRTKGGYLQKGSSNATFTVYWGCSTPGKHS